ncbi:MAG: Stp1/IreP family PP2C-type Ser/Thr phosphatase [Candidatus Limimorpha sp.]
MNDNYSYCHVVGKTDVGRKRAANEDNMYNTITQNGLVSVVCDGMGGHVGGATASTIAVSTIIENLNNVYYDDPRIAIGESIDRANSAIIQKATEQPDLAGMGSTCVLLLVRGGKVYIGHVGDSRIYLVRSKRIVQLTKDHSYVQMLVDCGEITKEQAEHHPRKNEITNALGIPNMSPATIADDAIVPEAGDCFVLCSDGLSGMVSDDTICKIISRQSEMNAQDRVDRLVALANENGGVDNITVQLVEFSVSPTVITDKKTFPAWAKITCIISVLLALGIGGYFWLCNKNGKKTEGEIQIAEMGPRCLGEISYEKNAEIVELEYSETTLVLKWGRDEKYTYTESNVSLDPTTLSIESENVISQYNNSLLVFTDKTPGESVIFSISTSDKSKIYKYQFNINNAEEKGGLSIPKGTIPYQGPKVEESKKADPKKEAVVAEVDTVYVQFEYDKLEKGSKLILNYSANPSLIFNSNDMKKEVQVSKSKLEKILDGLAYDDLYWTKKPNNGQLIFEFKGESSDKQHTIVIPCAVRDSEDQVVISVKIVPNQNKDDGVVSFEEKENSEDDNEVSNEGSDKDGVEMPTDFEKRGEFKNNNQPNSD